MQDNIKNEYEALGRLLFAKTAGTIDEGEFMEKIAKPLNKVFTMKAVESPKPFSMSGNFKKDMRGRERFAKDLKRHVSRGGTFKTPYAPDSWQNMRLGDVWSNATDPLVAFAKSNPWHAAGAGAGAMFLGSKLLSNNSYYGYPYPRRFYGGY